MKNLITRSISGLVYIALIISALLAGPYWFAALTALFAFLAVSEFLTLTCGKLRPDAVILASRTIDLAAAVALCLSTLSNALSTLVLFVFIMSIYVIARLTVALYDKRPNAFADVARSVMTVLYIGLPLASASAFNSLAWSDNSMRYLVLIVFVMIWLNDTGAYCVGCTLGRHRLFPRLSPKKSWEGFFGGLVFCIAVGIACFYSFDLNAESADLLISAARWIGLGITVCVFSTWGDLFESLVKRTVGVKDSGHLIPGHGGILDRIDSLLFVAPATFIYAIFTGLL